MATFTMELREVVEQYDIGLTDYPLFEESYREVLNKRIVDEFFFHEIGYETPEMFIHQLNHRMRLEMPPFNLLYESTRLEIDPLSTLRMRTVSESLRNSESSMIRNSKTEQSGESHSHSASDSLSKSRGVNSQFPQDMLAGNQDYATGAVDSNSSSNVISQGEDQSSAVTDSDMGGSDTAQDKGESDTLVEGFSGSQSELLMRYRETFINVDMMVLDSIRDLFMSIVGVDDSYNNYPNMPMMLGNGMGINRMGYPFR